MNKTLLTLFLLLCTLAVPAQNISGSVESREGGAVADASVVLLSKDSLFLDVAVTDARGKFSFEQKADTFRLVIHHLAFRPREVACTSSDAGCILLEPADVALSDIVVKGERPLVKVEEGKLSYDLQQLVKDKVANNTYEALTKLPGVREDNGKLTLVGSNSLSVIINGKPTTMTAEQFNFLLKTTPVDRVEKVEVMYSAPPEYHVRGAAINVVLKKDTQYSLQGEVGGTYRNKFYSEGEAHAFLRVTSPRHAFDIMYSADRVSDVQDIDMVSLHTFSGAVYDIRQLQKIRNTAWVHNTRASYEYNSGKNNISASYNRLYRHDHEGFSHSSGNFQLSDSHKEVDSDDMHNFSVSAKLGIGLSAGADYTMYKNTANQNMSVSYFSGNELKMEQDAGQKVRAFNAYADQKHAFGKGWTLGYGLLYRNSESEDFQIYSAESTLKGNDVNASLSEHTAVGYLSVGKQSMMGLSFSLSASLEYYRVNGRERWTLYPQGSLTFMRNPNHIWQGTLNVQTLYPSYWQMQEGVSYIDGYAELHNTPGLEPSKLYALNANYIFRQKYVFGAFMNYVDKMFAQTMYQSSDRLALIYQTHNWDYISQTGVLAVIPYAPAEWFNTRAMLMGIYIAQRCDNFFDIGFKDRSIVGVFSLDNTFKVGKDLSFELNGFVQTPATQGTFTIETMWRVSAGAKWNFAKGKGTLSCFYNDIFNSTIGDMKMNYKGQNLLNRNNFHSRSFTLSVAYRFGGYKKKEGKEVDTSRFGH